VNRPVTHPRIVAHRGAWESEPQNSLAAFARAMALGVDMIELDIRALRDGRPAVVHDAKVAGQKVDRMSLGELRAADPSAPLLEEVLELCAGKVLLDLELKAAGVEAECLALLQPHAPEGFLVTSFFAGLLDRVRRRNPRLATGLVARKGEAPELAEHCRLAGHRALLLHHACLPPVGRLPADLEVYAWTVNGEKPLAAALERGDLAGVVTDDPALALSLRASLP
jgi:glycerophosphoryl diester phosphodiesterase